MQTGDALMRFSRHAKNRLRRIARDHGGLTAARLREAVLASSDVDYDAKGNRRVRITVDDVVVTVAVDQEEGVIVTLWREE